MAARSLGTLTIDLIAKVGGFVQGMTEAERVADRKSRDIQRSMDKRAKAIEDSWKKMGSAITAGIAGITIAGTFKKIISESRNAGHEQAMLAAALRSTGNQAGYSQGRLNEMASAMEEITTKSSGEISQAQTVLLGFGNIVGEQLPKALMAAADYSTRTGADMKSAAEVMGRSLDIPSAGMASLVKQGFKFSESQIEAAKRLEQVGNVAAAQQIVFDALNETYGGAAVAAKDTFGGALDGLKNTINSLLTGGGGSLDDAKKSINELTSSLSSESVRHAFATLTSWVVDVTNAVITATSQFFAFGKFVGETFAKAVNGSADPIERLEVGIKSARVELKALNDELERPRKFTSGSGYGSSDEIRARRDDLLKDVEQMEKARRGLSSMALMAPAKASPASRPDMAVRRVGSVNLKDLEGARQAQALDKQRESQAKAYLKQLTEQIDKAQNLTAYEKLMADVKRGTVVLTGDQLDKAKGLTTVIDMTKELEKQRTDNLARQNLLFEVQERLMSRQHQYQLELATYGMGDRSASDMRERIGLIQKQQAELRKLNEDQVNAMALASTAKDKAGVEATYAERLSVIRDAHGQEISMFDTMLQQKREKELDWAKGAQSAFATYAENAQNMYQQTNQAVANMLGGMEDALVSFTQTGKADFKSFANSIIGDLLRIQARKAIVGLFGGAAGMFPSIGKMFGFADGGYTGPGGRMEPAGVVHRGEVVWSQKDVARAGGVGVVESMRRGLAGYADGGAVGVPRVVTSGALAASPGGVVVNVPVSVTTAGGGGQANEGALAAMGASLSKALTPMVQEIIGREQRPGGRLWNWANGRG